MSHIAVTIFPHKQASSDALMLVKGELNIHLSVKCPNSSETWFPHCSYLFHSQAQVFLLVLSLSKPLPLLQPTDLHHAFLGQFQLSDDLPRRASTWRSAWVQIWSATFCLDLVKVFYFPKSQFNNL